MLPKSLIGTYCPYVFYLSFPIVRNSLTVLSNIWGLPEAFYLLNIVRIKIPLLILVSENSLKYHDMQKSLEEKVFFNVLIILDSVFIHMYPWFCTANITLNIVKWKDNTSAKRSRNINDDYNSSTEWMK